METNTLVWYSAADVAFDPETVAGSGGFSTVHEGHHAQHGKVALKRLGKWGDAQREVATWRGLSHVNVLPFLGVLIDGDHMYLVSPWVENGSLRVYLAHNPEANRIRLLKDVAEGLAYLHDNDIVHGDVKGPNVLISQNIRAMLCDFGLSTRMDHHDDEIKDGVGTWPWMSPERLLGDEPGRTPEDDVYGFGMTVYEALSGQAPFSQYDGFAAIVEAVCRRRERPEFTLALSAYEAIWAIATFCWTHVSRDRPTMAQVLAQECFTNLPPYLEQEQVNSSSWPADALWSEDEIQTDTGVVTPLQQIEIASSERQFDIAMPSESKEPQPSSSDDVVFSRPQRLDNEMANFEGQSDAQSCESPGLIDSSLLKIGQLNTPFAGGHFADVFLANHRHEGKVALKRLRVNHRDPAVEQELRRFQREARLWNILRHKNILRFIGIWRNAKSIYLVSPYVPKGTVAIFARDKVLLIKEMLIVGMASGLAYLHEKGIIHGDFKGCNVLISVTGDPLVCDFGLSRLVEDDTTTGQRGTGTTRWQSPELHEDGGKKSLASDVYALGMTIYEVLTGNLPFPMSTNHQVTVKMVKLNLTAPFDIPQPHLPRPASTNPPEWQFWPGPVDEVTGETKLWVFANRCWQFNPIARPDMSVYAPKLVETLESARGRALVLAFTSNVASFNSSDFYLFTDSDIFPTSWSSHRNENANVLLSLPSSAEVRPARVDRPTKLIATYHPAPLDALPQISPLGLIGASDSSMDSSRTLQTDGTLFPENHSQLAGLSEAADSPQTLATASTSSISHIDPAEVTLKRKRRTPPPDGSLKKKPYSPAS